MTPNDIEPRAKQRVEQPEEDTRTGRWFVPAVDILESPEELTLIADMPGVAAEGVDLRIDGDHLTLRGRVAADDYAGLKPMHVEYAVGGYQRSFTVGETIDRDGIRAVIKNGVLTLHLPKAAHARQRRISVDAA